MESISESVTQAYYYQHFGEEEAIGSGGFGTVFKVKQSQTNQYYAIKKIPLKHEERDRVNKELDILSKLNNVYVIKLIHHWIENNYYGNTDFYGTKDPKITSDNKILREDMTHLLHIQTDLYPLTLRKLMEQFHTDSNTKLLTIESYYVAGYLFTELLNGVNYLHECKPQVIHRDFKPDNVLIANGESGSFVKICDFGLATEHEFEIQSHTQSLGTMQYMAPEVEMTRKYDTKADIYSLGIMLKEMFGIDCDNPIDSFDSFLVEYYSILYEICPQLTHIRVDKRWTCSQILEKLDMFFVSLAMFKSTKEYEAISTKPLDSDIDLEKNYISFILQKTKLSLLE